MKAVKTLGAAVGLLAFIGCTGTSGGSGNNGNGIHISAPSSVSFGQVADGSTSAPLMVVIENEGSQTATFSSAPSLSGTNAANFNITSDSCTGSLAPSASCSISITFSPTGTGQESALLSYTIAGLGTREISVKGSGFSGAANVLPAEVFFAESNVNALYVTITICVPGTSTCQTIPNVEVDTGSTGLRIVSSAISIPLQTATTGSNKLGNCVQFADMSYAFGPVKLADIRLSGRSALNQPIQVIADPNFASTPTGSNGCVVNGGSAITSASTLGGNGLIGIGLFKQDCGPACASSPIPATYYSCNSNSCSPTTVSTQHQLQNPISQFGQDNNGVIITMPSIPASGAAIVDGSIIFGINTASNNQLGSATIYTADGSGEIRTVYNSTTYPSFIDSGSNGLFFLNTAADGMPNCSTLNGFYCPNSTTGFSVANIAADSTQVGFNYSIANAANLFSSEPNDAGFNDLGGPFPGAFDFGMPAFYGRRILFGFENETIGSEQGPLYAY